VRPRSNSAEVELLYHQHGAVLLLFAMAIAGEHARAQDAVHQAFLKMLEGGSMRHVADVKAYLFTCVRNTVLNDTKARQRNVALDEESAWFDPPHRDYAAELNLRHALCALPEDQRQVVVLHVWGEFTFLTFARLRQAMGAKEDSCACPSR